MYKLLIVDDEPGIREGLEYLNWNSLNIEVAATAENGLKAFEFTKDNPIDIVVTDIKMPIMDGIELIQRIDELNKDIVVVALSGYDDFEYVKHCLKHRVFDYLLKPLDIDEWYTTFEKIVEHLNVSSDKDENIINAGIKGHSKNHIVQAAFNYMQNHFSEQLTLTTIANQVYTNPTYLSRVIKEETGMGFTELLTNLRIEASKKMLKNPTYKINEIAELVGYANPRYFTYAFKKHTGCTPYSYRSE